MHFHHTSNNNQHKTAINDNASHTIIGANALL